jgi:hypothetical protein
MLPAPLSSHSVAALTTVSEESEMTQCVLRDIATVAAVASSLIVGFARVTAAQTQGARQVTIVQEMAPVGLASGQTLRYSWANRTDADARAVFEPLHIVVSLLAADGDVLAQQEADAVDPGHVQFFDFGRSSIVRRGPTATDQLQVRVHTKLLGRSKWAPIALKPGKTAIYSDGLELIDDATGVTVASMGTGFNELSMDDTAGKEKSTLPGRSSISIASDFIIGLVPGQALRLNVSNPEAASVRRQTKPLFAFVVEDLDGRALVRGDEVGLDPGRAHSFEVAYSELSVTSSSSTGRVQVRAKFFHGIASRVSQGHHEVVPDSLEIIDTATGRTVVLMSSKPKEIVVVGSKIEP